MIVSIQRSLLCCYSELSCLSSIANSSSQPTRSNQSKCRIRQQNHHLFRFTTFKDGNFNNKNDQDDDDDSLSFAELLQRQEQKQNNISKDTSEQPQKYEDKYQGIEHKNINVKERVLKDEEITKHTKQTFIYDVMDNPFFNPDVAAIQNQVNSIDEEFRQWQYNFQVNNKRKPSLRDIKQDPQISSMLEERAKRKKAAAISVFRFKIND